MASTPRTPRRGLPRVPGGEPWPPAAADVPGLGAEGRSPEGADVADPARGDASGVEVSAVPSTDAAGSALAPRSGSAGTAAGGAADVGPVAETAPGAPVAETAPGAPVGESAPGAPVGERAPGAPVGGESAGSAPAGETAPGAGTAVRRGLPREPGGEPWPPASVAASGHAGAGAAPEPDRSAGIASVASHPIPAHDPDSIDRASGGGTSHPAAAPVETDAVTGGARRGLPREPGGEPWPPASAFAGPREGARSDERAGVEAGASARPISMPAPDSGVAPAALAPTAPRPPLTVRRTVWPGAAARRAASGSVASPRSTVASPALRDYSPVQLLGSAAVLGVFALALVGIAVLLARFVLAIGPGREFLAAFPGEYALPASAPVGLPAWLNWSHFLNSFFLLLIIRTGWQVRREKRPSAFWSPRTNKKRRISLALWFHQALDILWIANGVIFVVLLFVTGQWMRIVPTSWEVFPNALSAALQYASLDWPTENGWVNYNSLQQLSYFAITFVAAPLAIVSGVRLSGVWPKDAEKLNRLYPVEWARKVHFPTMLFFVAFIVVHVALVLATGALRNLNHMYAARGSVDPEAFTSDPTGLLIFAASLVVMAAAWIAARPAVLVPIARLFGEVKQR